ncbi:MAG: DUF5681 domain-containing protein [Pseudomonadota bacterium]
MQKSHAFQPGNNFGKGRPAGSKNNAQLFLEKVGSEHGEVILTKVIEQALAGDLHAQKLILDRIYPIPKARNFITSANLKNIRTQAHINEAMTAILDQVGDSRLSLEEGHEAVKLIEAKAVSIQKCMNEELESIRARLTELQGNSH